MTTANVSLKQYVHDEGIDQRDEVAQTSFTFTNLNTGTWSVAANSSSIVGTSISASVSSKHVFPELEGTELTFKTGDFEDISVGTLVGTSVNAISIDVASLSCSGRSEFKDVANFQNLSFFDNHATFNNGMTVVGDVFLNDGSELHASLDGLHQRIAALEAANP